MYISLLFVFLSASIVVFGLGLLKNNHVQTAVGTVCLIAAILFLPFLSFWGEMLWFDSIGQAERFWRVVAAKAFGFFFTSIIGLVALYAATRSVPEVGRRERLLAACLGSLFIGYIGYHSWDEILLYMNRVSTGIPDPLLGRDTGFYLFVLPLLDRLFWVVLCVPVFGLFLLALSPFFTMANSKRAPENWRQLVEPVARPIAWLTVLLAVVLTCGILLGVYHLLYSKWGVVAGPGWIDAKVRLPGLWITAALTFLLGVIPVLRVLQKKVAHGIPLLTTVIKSWVAIAAVWLFTLFFVPTMLQWLVVEPNEISFERPYIANNIEFTRHGFRLNEIEVRQFPASDVLSSDTLAENEHLLSEIRLWDWRALDAVYKQFQEMRLYFEFHDVDMDRYMIGDDYRQVMISAREMSHSNLPPQSSTFVNKRFKYTHGYGMAMSTVSDFTETGLPNLLVKDIPPSTEFPSLEVTRPQVYYGELTHEPAVVKSEEQEFDHPSGDENVYITYDGTGGVQLKNLWRKFVYGWKFDGTRFFFSTYMTPETRVLFHRQILKRVSSLAPFLKFDSDPYLVLTEGKLYWIIDGYTTSSYYPYSEPLVDNGTADYLHGVNYVRNSVKAVVDAYNGTTTFYVYEPDDPLISAWRSAFPKLFADRDTMPENLKSHVRYPEDFLLAQGLVYAKYHMNDADVFYNQEDLWVRATEKYYSEIRPLDPYYVMWQLPGKKQAEFVLMLPFTPKNRQVMIGWIAGMCDADNYGRFLAYKFPKEKRVLGPQQVETKIDQDSFLSGQLTLWDQRGSKVIRGNVLAIPIQDTLLYVEPIYLQAETAAYPELRLVVVMHEDTMSYADTFEKALMGLIKPTAPNSVVSGQPTGEMTQNEMALAANSAFNQYLEHLGAQRFEEAAAELRNLQELLNRLVEQPVN
jgi:hypothetical protein